MATNYKIEVRFLYGAPKRYEALMVKRLSEEQHKTVRARPYRPVLKGEKEQINKARMVRATEVSYLRF
jgi:hypothetical protein